jgi:hypothetical protein
MLITRRLIFLFYESGRAALQAAAPPVGGCAAYLCICGRLLHSTVLYCTDCIHVTSTLMTFILADFCIYVILYFLYIACCMLTPFA